MLYETGGLRYGGQVPMNYHNVCGLKNKDGSGFSKFPDWDSGVLAHVAHVAAYVYPEHVNSFCNFMNDERHPRYHWNSVKVVGDFGGKDQYGRDKWSPNPEYPTNLLRIWNKGV